MVAVGAVGLQIPRKIYYEKELDFRVSRSYGPGRYDPSYEEGGQDYPIGFARWTEGRNLEAIVNLIAERRLDIQPLITHRFPIDQASDAYQLITGKVAAPYLGVLLTYPQTGEITSLNDGRKVFLRPNPSSVPMEKIPGVGVLGAGNYASAVFLPTIQKAGGSRLVGIASGSGLTARQSAARFGFSYAATGDDQILSDPDVDLVVILTRHNLHAAQVLSALANGKHVYCEKPLATDPSDLVKIAEALTSPREPQSMLTVGFNRRFAPHSLHLREFIASSGEPFVAQYRVNAGFLPLTHWTQDPAIGVGRIVGEACHFIDYLACLADAAPVSVHAQALPDGGRYRQDNVVLTLTFPDGSLGTVTYVANGDRSLPKERVEVFTAGRAAVLDDFRALELIQNGRRKSFVSRLRQDKGHQAAWESFIKAIIAGGPPPIPYGQLMGVTQATFAALDSLRTSEIVAIHPLSVG